MTYTSGSREGTNCLARETVRVDFQFVGDNPGAKCGGGDRKLPRPLRDEAGPRRGRGWARVARRGPRAARPRAGAQGNDGGGIAATRGELPPRVRDARVLASPQSGRGRGVR